MIVAVVPEQTHLNQRFDENTHVFTPSFNIFIEPISSSRRINLLHLMPKLLFVPPRERCAPRPPMKTAE